MKRSLTTLSLCLLPVLCMAQANLTEITQSQYAINRTGMTVLGSWAIANIGIGFFRMQQTSGEAYHFNQMNAMWNTVNVGLAAVGFFTAGQILDNQSLSAVLGFQNRFEKILLVNAALDVGYMITGLYLKERSKNSVKNTERFAGFGKSLILQGGFLLVFDTVMYLVHHTNNDALMKAVDALAFNYSPTMGISAGLSLQF